MQNDLFAQEPPANPSIGLIESLDPEQREAATAPDGQNLVRAGAGTGKTRTLVARILHLVQDRGVSPRNIMAVTFTRKAAGEIRSRISSLLGAEVAASLRVGTFHALSSRILRKHAEAIGLDPKFMVIDEGDAEAMMAIAVSRSGVLTRSNDEDPEGEKARLADITKAAITRVQQWKSWGLTAEMASDPDRKLRNEGDERLARVYVTYQAELNRLKKLDFGDLVLSVVSLFGKHPEIQDLEASKVQHLLIDEAQDANPVQVTWARCMSSRYRNVFAVGDEDQSIFSFQGGYPGALVDITGIQANRFGLTRNRRCTEEVLVPAVELVGYNRRTSTKVLSSGVHGDPVDLRIAGAEREEANAIASSISKHIAAGTSPDQIAILLRSGFAMVPIEEALIKAGIEYEMVGGSALLKREEIRDVLGYFSLALDPYNYLAFQRVCNRPTRAVGAVTEQAVANLMLTHRLTAWDAISRLDKVEGYRPQGPTREGLDHLSIALHELHEAVQEPYPPLTSSRLVAMILDEVIGYRKFVTGRGKKPDKKRLENLAILERIAAEVDDLLEFSDEVALSQEEDVQAPRNKVRISTMHSAKGLEWDIVYCPAFEVDIVPNKRALGEVRGGSATDPWNGPSGGGMEEERRLAHVAFTRARKLLYVSCSLSRNGRDSAPSPFLPESGLDPMMNASMTMPVKKARSGRAQSRAGRKGFFRPL